MLDPPCRRDGAHTYSGVIQQHSWDQDSTLDGVQAELICEYSKLESVFAGLAPYLIRHIGDGILFVGGAFLDAEK